jgi:hypothetical protein
MGLSDFQSKRQLEEVLKGYNVLGMLSEINFT